MKNLHILALSLVKEVSSHGGNIKQYVPDYVYNKLNEKNKK